MIPAEHLYDSCTCDGGMRNGLRCADCGGRGLVPKGTKPTGETVAEDSEDGVADDLDNLSMTDLRELAKNRGVSAGGGRKAIADRIRAAADGEAVIEDGSDAHTADDDAEGDGESDADGDGA